MSHERVGPRLGKTETLKGIERFLHGRIDGLEAIPESQSPTEVLGDLALGFALGHGSLTGLATRPGPELAGSVPGEQAEAIVLELAADGVYYADNLQTPDERGQAA